MTGHDFIQALATVLCVAAVTTVLFQRLRQPVVLGYLLAGLIIGPHIPIPLVADLEIVQALSELGVILLMFSLGLEFSIRTLARLGPTAGLTAVIQCSLMVWLGYLVGRALGWTSTESLYVGALLAISSTTIIAKAFDEQGIRGRLRELVVGVLIVEDLIAILLMAALTALSRGTGLSLGALSVTAGQLGAFLVGLLVVGFLVVPRLVRAVVRLGRPETTLVVSIGLCFAAALVADAFGYSVALGAFLAGSLVAESGEAKQIEDLVRPVRDVFAAVFFVSVGMLIDPAVVWQYAGAVVALTAVVVVGKIVGVTLGAFLTGNGVRTSVAAGMSLAQIGEFSFIIAGLGLSLKATGEFLYPVAVTVSALTTLTTPWLIRLSGPVASWVDSRLPPSLQTFASLYASWVERLGATRRTGSSGLRRRGLLLLADAVLLAGLVVALSMFRPRLVGWLEGFGLGGVAGLLILFGTLLLAIPFCLGIVRIAGRLAADLAERSFPPAPQGKPDLGQAPRRLFAITLQLLVVLVVGTTLLALTQPFLSGLEGGAVLLGLVGALGVGLARNAAQLQGHLRAGVEVILEVLARQSRHADEGHLPAHDDLAQVRNLLPGLGEPVSVRLEASSRAVGQTLASLNLRGVTGATVLALRRATGEVLVPTAKERLEAGDTLALAGSREAIGAARELLGKAGEAS